MTQQEFIEKFLSNFAKNLSNKEKRLHHIGDRKKDFLWNVFAGRLVPCYEGNEARKIYDSVDKAGAIEICYSGYNKVSTDDAETSIIEEKHKTAIGIDEDGLVEFYVIGKNFEWCYVVTHELDLCGPYFCFYQNN